MGSDVGSGLGRFGPLLRGGAHGVPQRLRPVKVCALCGDEHLMLYLLVLVVVAAAAAAAAVDVVPFLRLFGSAVDLNLEADHPLSTSS